MAEEHKCQVGFGVKLRERLALAVRDIEWSYAIFWSISSSQTGVLEWGEGYYNGEIKTRKTVQAAEVSGEEVGLQRTEQLRELYESLLAGEANPNPHSKLIHSVALSPEDLTDTEWYFLVCMSFLFNFGQGLPGRALAKNQSIWLCNAHQADSRIFTRSLLAKSASIQTVVCFPYLGGVVELGVTDLVSENPDLVHHIRTSYLDILPHTLVTNVPNYEPISDAMVGSEELDINPFPPIECDDINICSPYKHSNGFGANPEEGDSFMVEDMNGEASQLQNWKFADDDISNCIHNSANSSDCISQNYVNPPEQGVDLHYQTILSNLLKSSHQFILGPYFRSGDTESSFVTWKKGISSSVPRTRTPPQRILKKILLDVARMHGRCSTESRRENGVCKTEADETDKSRVLSERRRREKLNERLMILASLIPTSTKVDKISILDETIEYVKDLERRVREVESARTRGGDSCDDDDYDDDGGDVEMTSDNCWASGAGKGKKPEKNSLPRKRKKSMIGAHKGPAKNNGLAHGGVTVSVIGEDIMIEMRCGWSDGVLVRIMEALNRLHLVCHCIQSSNSDDGILSVSVKAKMEESRATSMAVIRQALQRLVA